MAKHKSAANHIRIISGQWRSRKLPVHDAEGLRPTTDRIKETVFNWLMTDVKNARVLDCFAGSGSLGFEALSRFAGFTHFFELNPQAAKQLTANLATLKCDNAEVSQGDTLTLLEQAPKHAFDLVFIDPPFRKGLVGLAINKLTAQPWLADEALIYVETESELTSIPAPPNWRLLKEKSAGQVTSRLYLSETME